MISLKTDNLPTCFAPNGLNLISATVSDNRRIPDQPLSDRSTSTSSSAYGLDHVRCQALQKTGHEASPANRWPGGGGRFLLHVAHGRLSGQGPALQHLVAFAGHGGN